MSDTLILRSSPTSPYVRKVLVLAHEIGLYDQIEQRPAEVWEDEKDISSDNPLGRIPALDSPHGHFCDSISICTYLDSLHDGKKRIPVEGDARWRSEQFRTLGNGLMDCAVGHTIEKLRRPADKIWPDYLERLQRKIVRTLDSLEDHADKLSARATLGEIAVGVALAYLDLRLSEEIDWRHDRPLLAAWHAGFSDRPSMIATMITP